MSRIGTLAAVSGIVLMLAACNTTDALTPQVDIGDGGTKTSSPVTQNDLDRMATAADNTAPGQAGSAYQASSYPPQNTLDAQAQALASGAQHGQPMQPMPAHGAQASPQTQSAALSPSSGAGAIRFLPIIGAPVQAVTPLSRQLGAEARAKGLTIRSSNDTSAEHILKGYLSAFADGGKVTVVYVWDVLDNSGSRLHRLQGQETMPARGSDPWAAVSNASMEKIAARTLNDYLSWKQTQAS